VSNGDFAIPAVTWHDLGEFNPEPRGCIVGIGPKAELLFKEKFDTVWVTIYGPPIGWQWTRVNYFRLVKSTKDPTKWERRDADREVDQKGLGKANRAVQQFYKERDRGLKENFAPPTDTRG
jgi:hypothetical protein